MGDLPPGSAPQPLDTTATGLAHDGHQSSAFRSPTRSILPHSQLSSLAQGQVHPSIHSPARPASPYYPPQEHSASSLDMGSMVGALPEYAPVEPSQTQRPLSGASTSAVVYQLQQNLQMPGHGSSSLPTHPPYGSGFSPRQYQQNLVPNPSAHTNFAPAPFPPNQHRLHTPSTIQTPYQSFHQPSQYLYYPTPYGPQGQLAQGFPAQSAQVQTVYGRRSSLTNVPMPPMGQNVDLSQAEGTFPPGSRLIPGAVQAEPGPIRPILSGTFSASDVRPSGPVSPIPRGPPRKPKQSGHALWVGNLPPGTTVMALKDHFSQDATKDIESLFLISKSNCAFVNYRTEASCTAAMHRFHDSRFDGARLVCRLRRSPSSASGVPAGPSAMTGNQPAHASPPRSPQDAEVDEAQDEAKELPTRRSAVENRHTSTAKEKYFVVKSLTLQDLELSVRNGIWATQSHNEGVLNKAYELAENVYLIFSVNKSGEYFGYARMASPILKDTTHPIGPVSKPEVLDAIDIPKSIPTPATEFAPRGRIIDDSARGTIFWEAESSGSEAGEAENEKEEPHVEGDTTGVAQSLGRPFKVEWISTTRLPFYRTRGLRNPWNANREVKIARDGTELETSVGERLIQMFHRLGSPSGAGPVGAPMMQPPHLGGPQMRQI